MFWLTENLKPFLVEDKTTAKYVLVGSGEMEEGKFGYGIFCGVNDPFTAYRVRNIIRMDPKNEVDFSENSPELLQKISDELQKVIDQARQETANQGQSQPGTTPAIPDVPEPFVPDVLEKT